MEPPRRLPVIGVMGSSRETHTERAGRVGAWLAGLGVHLLTGGGGGVMESVSRAFHLTTPRKGLVIGVVPGEPYEDGVRFRDGYPNPWVEIPIFTHLPLRAERGNEPLSRNHINVLSSNAIIALPGSAGTASEVSLALRYGRPVVAYLEDARQIDGLDDAAVVEPDFAKVQEFVKKALGAGC